MSSVAGGAGRRRGWVGGRSGRARPLTHFPLVGPLAVAALVFLYVPLLVIIGYAFNKGDQATVWEGATLEWFPRVLRNHDIVDAAIVSLQLAACAMVVSTALALGIALVLDRWGRRGRRVALGLIQAPLIVPEIVAAVGTLGLIRVIGLRPGMAALVLAHTAFCIPFALLPIRARLADIDPRVFEAGADLGADQRRLFQRIVLPLLLPGIVSGALLAFIVSLDDFIISSFLASAQTTTLPVYMFGLIRRGISPGVNAIATLLIALSTLVVLITRSLTRERHD